MIIVVTGAAIVLRHAHSRAEGKVTMEGKVILQFEARESSSHLELSYRITNNSSHTIYTTDVGIVVQRGGTAVVGFQPRISWEAPATILLSTRLQSLDPTVARATPPRVYARRLLPGESVDNKTRLPLPLRVTGALPSDKEEKIVCSKIRFEISAILDSDALSAREQRIGDHPMWLLSSYARREQLAITAEQIGVAVPLLLER